MSGNIKGLYLAFTFINFPTTNHYPLVMETVWHLKACKYLIDTVYRFTNHFIQLVLNDCHTDHIRIDINSTPGECLVKSYRNILIEING